MSQSYILGIDIGTGSIKAVAINQKAEIIYTNQIFYSVSNEDQNEQDVEMIFECFQQMIKLVVDSLSVPQLISLSSAMHSILAVDESGKPLTKAILWSDKRSSDIAEALRQSEDGKHLYEATGTPVHAMSPLGKIKWLHENEKTIFERTFKFISIKEFIWHRLFGEYKIDYSIASAAGLFNIKTLDWDETALTLAGITKEKLSLPVSTNYQQTIRSNKIADALQLSVGIVFCIGASDGSLANLGSLCLDPSEAAITIGTSAAVRITSPKPLVNYKKMIFNYLLNEQTFVCGGALNNGGNVIEWLLQKFLKKSYSAENYSEVFHSIENLPAGCKGLLFLPYINGERAPIWDEKSSGVFIGIQSFHDQNYFARAAAEGVCFALREIVSSLEEIAPIKKIKVSGGLSKEIIIMQILSDVLDKEIIIQSEADVSALGAAYLGLKILNPSFDLKNISAHTVSILSPKKENIPLYEQLFSIYQSLYPNLKTAMHLLYQYH